MYKSHIKRWDLSKNLAARDLPEMLHERAKLMGPDKNSTDLVIRGRRVHPLTIERYLKRSIKGCPVGSKERQDSPFAFQSIVPPKVPPGRVRYNWAPAPAWMDSPDDTTVADEVIRISQQLVDGCCESGTWTRNGSNVLFISTRTHEWINAVQSANTLIRAGRPAQGFSLLNRCFDEFRLLLLELEPALLVYTYYAIMMLPKDIGQRLLSYAVEVSAITLSPTHPMTLIWTKLERAGIEQASKHAWRILSSYYHILNKRYRHCEADMLNLANILYECMSILGLVELETIEAKQMSITDRLEVLGCTDEALFSKSVLAGSLYRDGKYDLAGAIVDEIHFRMIQRSAMYKSTGKGGPLPASCAMEERKPMDRARDGAEEKHLCFDWDTHGRAHVMTIMIFRHLHAFMKHRGVIQEADRLGALLSLADDELATGEDTPPTFKTSQSNSPCSVDDDEWGDD
jgi:hypothetical protein